MPDVSSYINEQTLLYCALTAFILACFRGCLLRIPYATILSTLISTCGLIIGFVALFDATYILEHFTHDLLQRDLLILNDLKVGYVASKACSPTWSEQWRAGVRRVAEVK